MDIEISVVMPCLNEERTVGICIEKCLKIFEQLGIKGEVIVVDNGSEDNSASIAEQKGARVIYCNEKGYGNALRFGFKAANGRLVVMADADNTYDFLELPLLYEKMIDDVQMVLGTRLNGQIQNDSMPFLHRYLGTPLLTFILNLLYGTRISDSQSGMRLIRKKTLDLIKLRTTGMEFASELLVEFAKHRFKIVEVPITLHVDIEGRIPHLRPWRDGFRHLLYLIIARFY